MISYALTSRIHAFYSTYLYVLYNSCLYTRLDPRTVDKIVGQRRTLTFHSTNMSIVCMCESEGSSLVNTTVTSAQTSSPRVDETNQTEHLLKQ